MNYFRRFLAWIGTFFFERIRYAIANDFRILHESVDRAVLRFEKFERDQQQKTRPLFVILQSTIGMMASRVVLSPGETGFVRFVPQFPIPAGAWISTVGDGYITSVSVGNMSQFLSHPAESPFCITRDASEVGNVISVKVKGNES
jgi:hypothetical protein